MSYLDPHHHQSETFPTQQDLSSGHTTDMTPDVVRGNPPSYRDEMERTQSFYSSQKDGSSQPGGGGVVVGEGGIPMGGMHPHHSSHIPMDARSTDLGASTIATDDDADDVARLYVMCELAMPRPEEQGVQMSAPEMNVRDEKLGETWANIREWLTAHPSPEERHLAATHLGHFSTTALHLVCKLNDPPKDIVQALIECSPEIATWADSNGWLPLHHACANGASGEVLSILCEAFPDGKVTQDRRRRTPLHFAFFRSDTNERGGSSNNNVNTTSGGIPPPSSNHDGLHPTSTPTSANPVGNSMAEIVGLLSDSEAAKLPDEGGMLPMHYACAYGTNTEVLDVLKKAYPESITSKENKGRTPLHLTMVNAHRSASPAVLRFLLSQGAGGVVSLADSDGHLPLFLLAMAARFSPEQAESRQNACDCLEQYLNAQPKASADFFSALQALPEWLRDRAVVSTHIHNILNEKIAKRFPTMLLLLDFYMLIVIIVCFEIASRDAINARFDPDKFSFQAGGFLIAVFCGGFYFLLREVMQVISQLNLGTFRSWLFEPTNWLDMTLIFFCFYFGTTMTDVTRGFADESFRTGIAAAKGVFWGAVISFLKSTLVDFAVFVGGVIYVVQRLLAFLVALVVILLAFAQMFHMVFFKTETCLNVKDMNQLDDLEAHCTFQNSFLKVYTMLMGEVGDAEARYNTNVSQFLYVAFAFVVVIILSNVLIAIVTDSYGVIKNERAAMVFWSSRLDFVAEVDGIASVLKRVPALCMCRTRSNSSSTSGAPGVGGDAGNGEGSNDARNLQETSEEGIVPNEDSSGNGLNANANPSPPNASTNSSSNSAAAGAAAVANGATTHDVATHRGKELMKEWWLSLMSLFDPNLVGEYDVQPCSFEFWLTYLFRAMAIVFIFPLWLLAGLITAGWLWPPQVREWLFVQRQAAISRADIAEQLTDEITNLKEEIEKLRLDMRKERNGDRKDLSNVKAEVEQVQKDVMEDLHQVTDLMKTLLDLGRARRERQ